MAINIRYLSSAIHDEKKIEQAKFNFINRLEDELGEKFNESSFENVNDEDLNLIFVVTGGVEGKFKEIYKKLKGPYYLLTNGENNSFAASLEILTFLKQQGLKGEILHGSLDYVSKRISQLKKIKEAKSKLSGRNIGLIGKPSDWLIASDVDYDDLLKKFGIKAIEISEDELLEEIRSVDINQLNELKKDKKIKDLYEKAFSIESLDGAMKIYLGLKNIVKKYDLQALTIRCFDLITKVKSTTCIALSLLNDEGIVSACEGDVPSLISMIILNALTNEPAFMANPSSIDIERNEVILAHCTIPLNMVDNYVLDTHFESGTGVGIHGEIRQGQATLFKLNNNLKDYFVSPITIEENMYYKNLCRTQIRVHMAKDVSYFLTNPMGNHHIICKDDVSQLVDEFMNYLDE